MTYKACSTKAIRRYLREPGTQGVIPKGRQKDNRSLSKAGGLRSEAYKNRNIVKRSCNTSSSGALTAGCALVALHDPQSSCTLC